MAETPIKETHVRSRTHKSGKRSFAWQIVKGILWFLVLGVVLGLVWYTTRLPFFTITNIQVKGGETVSLEGIRHEVDALLSGTYFLLIPKRFSYLYPHDRIVEVVSAHDRIHDVVVERSSLTSLGVSFEEYVPHALWCTDAENASCYFMTKSGYAYDDAPKLDGDVFVRHVKEGVLEVHEGEVLQKELLTKLDLFLFRLREELGLRVSSVLHKANGDATLFVNGGGALYITLGGDLDRALDHLKAIFASEEFEHIEAGNFKYIDIRFEKKAYVNEEWQVVASSTPESTTTLPEL